MRRIVGAAVFLLLAGCDGANGADLGAGRSADTRGLKVSAAEMSKAFLVNTTRAKAAYGGHKLEVSGEIKGIDFGLTHRPVIKLRGFGDTMDLGVTEDGKVSDVSINGLSDDEAAKLSKGQALTFLCRGADEVASGAQLSDCRIKA
ncbi:hypothetical protein [Novosphingobium rosa]|uniref:hypothetical protein n=1 Tax=Novosphingobium rosa TaxID=76978 RepID=UPI0008323CD7|nr:hypothetical protein [Novosphingobium rosa]